MTVSEMQVKVSADTKDAESGLARFGQAIQAGAGIGLGMKVLDSVFDGIGAAIKGSVGAATEFESKMSAVKAVSGATATEMGQLSTLALDLGKSTSFSASEAAEGIGELVKAGVSIGDVMGGAAAGALSLAAAGAVEVADAAEITSNALNAFGLSGTQAVHVADQIAGAANASAIDVNDFKFSLAAVGAVANTVGFSFEDTTAAIALLGNAGIKGSDAGTSLKTMFLNLQPATDKQTSLFRELGLITEDGANKFFDATGKVKGMSEVAGTLQTALQGMTQQQKLATLETIFGSDAIRAAAVFANEGAAGIDKMSESIGKISAADVAKERLNNLKGSLEQLTGSLETAGIMIGGALTPGLKTMVDGATEGVNQGIEIIGRLPGAWEDVKSLFTDGSTDANLENLLMDLGLSAATVTAVDDLTAQIGDAWRTMQQAFAGDWAPSDQIDPLVNSLGTAVTAMVSFRDTVVDAVAKAQAMGAWDNVAAGFSNLGDAAGIARDRLDDIMAAFGRAKGPSSEAASAADVLATALKGAALGFEYVSIQVKGAVDTIGSAIAVVIDFTTGLSRTGDALTKLKQGDFPGAVAALGEAKDAFGAGLTAAEEFRQRGIERVGEATKVMAEAVSVEMTATAAAVETNMGAANQAVAEGSSGWQREMEANGAATSSAAETSMAAVATATESGMSASVAAIEAQSPAAVAGVEAMATGMTGALEAAGPQMVTAADTAAAGVVSAVVAQEPAASAAATAMGTGMAAGIETAGPAMAAAADGAAASAVSAVQGHEGAASGVGQSLGSALGSGLEGGILAYVGRVAAAAASLVSSALSAGQAEGEIQSPSKKTTRDGQMIGQGYIDGLASMEPEMRARVEDFVGASLDYVPVGREIARVEREIKDVRDRSQTDALFRAKEMITIDSEALRLKQAQVTMERDLLPLRQDLARASREVADIERGSLGDRTRLIEMDGQRKGLRLQEIELEKQLIGLKPGDKKAESIQKQIDKLRDASRALDLESEKTRLTSDVAATSSRVKREALDDQARGQQTVIDRIKDQIDVLGAEQSVFSANETVIKNATDNEVGYRNRLIAVFTAEGKPLADRVTAGLALVTQLEKEGKISKELADELRGVAKEAGVGSEKTAAMGNAAANAAPQIDSAAKKAAEMADAARKIAEQAGSAGGKVDALSKSLGKLPDWFRPKGSDGGLFTFGGGRADGGPVKAGTSYLVGERGVPEMFTPSRSGVITPLLPATGGDGGLGPMQRIQIDVTSDGRTMQRHWIEGYRMLARTGGLPARFGDIP